MMRAIMTPFLSRGSSSETPPLNQENQEGGHQDPPNQEEDAPAPLARELFAGKEKVGDTFDQKEGDEKEANHESADPKVMLPQSLVQQLISLAECGRTSRPVAEERKDLPKIEYSKLVTLSLSNFAEYKEAIRVLGYSRKWPPKFAEPTLKDLKRSWDPDAPETAQEEKDRREAYLVLYQTIPTNLKYLVKNVIEGDVTGIWVVLYERFLQVTPQSLKAMKREWENIKQGSLPIDEFVSHVSSQAKQMRMVGERISDQDEATALVCGLSEPFLWIQTHYNMQDSYSFAQASAAILKFAGDRDLLNTPAETPVVSKKSACIKFNEDGCSRRRCPYDHRKVSKSVLEGLKKSLAPLQVKIEESKDNSVLVTKYAPRCFVCQSKDHLADTCPYKKQVSELVAKLKEEESDDTAAVAHEPVRGDDPVMMPAFLAQGVNDCDWILDSGASQHITNCLEWMIDPVPVQNGALYFTCGNEQLLKPSHVGSVRVGGVVLSEVYFCSKCPLNLMSEAKLLAKGADVHKTANDRSAKVLRGNRVLLKAEMRNNLFVITQACKGNNTSKLIDVKVQEPEFKVAVEDASVRGFQTVGIAFQNVAVRTQGEAEPEEITPILVEVEEENVVDEKEAVPEEITPILVEVEEENVVDEKEAVQDLDEVQPEETIPAFVKAKKPPVQALVDAELDTKALVEVEPQKFVTWSTVCDDVEPSFVDPGSQSQIIFQVAYAYFWCSVWVHLQFARFLVENKAANFSGVQSVFVVAPARTKRVSRNTPLAIREKKRKKKAREKSRSSHDPPLIASCPGCFEFLEWDEKRCDWNDCLCDDVTFCYCCNRSRCVVCSVCDGVAARHRKLDQWLCPHCLQDDRPRSTRKKKPD